MNKKVKQICCKETFKRTVEECGRYYCSTCLEKGIERILESYEEEYCEELRTDCTEQFVCEECGGYEC